MAAKNINKELLIEAVRKLPCLYDTSKKEYKDEIVRENAWKTVCQEIFKEQYESAKELGEGLYFFNDFYSTDRLLEYLFFKQVNRFRKSMFIFKRYCISNE